MIFTRRKPYKSRLFSPLLRNKSASFPHALGGLRELAQRTLAKVDALTEEEYAELALYAADEV